jgi:chromosome partitioning protein
MAVGLVLAVANQKGGVGKTTTAINLGACLAERGRRTLLVDVDPQANATVGLGVSRRTYPGLYDGLCGTVPLAEAIVPTRYPNLDLVPPGEGLAGANAELPKESGSEWRLRELLSPIVGRFDFLLLDCPPSLGPLTVNALVAADQVLIPIQSEYFALEGLAALLETLGLIQRELNPRLRIAGLLLTMQDGRTKLGRDVEAEIRQHFPEMVFRTVIPRNVRLGEAPSFGVAVIEHDPGCAGAAAYRSLTEELVAATATAIGSGR